MKKKIIIISVVLVLLAVCAAVGYYAYRVFMAANINANPESPTYKYLYVRADDTWDDVIEQLDTNGWISSIDDLKMCIKYLEKEVPQCGKYDLEPNLPNRVFVNRLAYGLSNKGKLQLKLTRYTPVVAKKLSDQLAIDSASLADVFLADTLLQKYGLDQESSLALFVRFDTTIQWCASAKEVEACVLDARHRFWNEERLEKAKKLGLSLKDIHILASIVEEESNDYEDRRKIAGVYLNRLRIKMPLQADPTARFAVGDFTLNRILKKHIQIKSPYNTYVCPGLPPGPIRIPTNNSIDAVLNYVSHNYIYFCAKADFSGTHNFAVTYTEHLRNARAYQKAITIWIREKKAREKAEAEAKAKAEAEKVR
ncbi:MAG: endolytic transglycosylase MltG [Paludibacteraceae bacterium]|nr:endolytic transglycosylase MltG [Paludibacteraceae bacterium]